MAAAKAEAQRTKRQPPLPATPRSVQATETSFKVVESACTRSHRLQSGAHLSSDRRSGSHLSERRICVDAFARKSLNNFVPMILKTFSAVAKKSGEVDGASARHEEHVGADVDVAARQTLAQHRAASRCERGRRCSDQEGAAAASRRSDDALA